MQTITRRRLGVWVRKSVQAGVLSSSFLAVVVGATFSVIHAQLLQQPPEPLSALLNALMATIVLPYRGRKAAAKEITSPTSKAGPDFVSTEKAAKSARSRQSSGCREGSRQSSGSRAGLTVRTYAVLAAVGERPGVSNREVSDLVRVADQGQISRLMARLEDQGLVENTGGHIQGVAKAWRLTPRGEEILCAGRPESERSNGRPGVPRTAR